MIGLQDMIGKNVIFLNFGKRISRALINAISLIGTAFILYFFVFSFPFNTNNETKLRLDAFINSGLYIEKDDSYTLMDSSNYLDYENIIKKYYVGKINEEETKSESYFDTSFYKNNFGKRTSKDIEWYNLEILEISETNEFFQYKIVDNQIDKKAFGVIKESCYEIKDGQKKLIKEKETLIYNFFKNKYLECFNDLYNDEFYLNATNTQKTKNILRTFCSIITPSTIFYLLIPLIFKKTISDFIFRSEIVNTNGTYIKRYKVLIRWIPQVIVILFSLVSENIYIFLTVCLLYFIINCISILLTKEHFSLPDSLSKTCLADISDSIIFNTKEEQIEYEENMLKKANEITETYYEKGDE